MTILEENEKLNIEIKKIIENLNSENKKSKKKKNFKILRIIFIIILAISVILLKNNLEYIKNKIFKNTNDTITNKIISSTKEENSTNDIKTKNTNADANDNKKLFRTTLGELNYVYISSNSNENTINREIKIDLDNDGEKEEINFGDDGDGIYFSYYNPIKDKVQFLLDNEGSRNPETVNYYFDAGWIRKDVDYQITALDLDDDGIKEIIFSAYDKENSIIALHSYIWKKRNEEYEYIGEIEGKSYMYYNNYNKSIVTPLETQGLYKEYRIENQRIKEISMKNNKNESLENVTYETYNNELFGFSLEYPVKLFEKTYLYDDRLNLETRDSEANINCIFKENLSNQSLESIYEEKLNSINTEISYKKLRENDFIISYKKNENIHYIKGIFNSNKKTFMYLEFKYSTKYKDTMDPIIERMTKSINAE